jgi:hypothetical protein
MTGVTLMSEHSDRQSDFLRALLGSNAAIAGDVVQLGHQTWAIHGSIPVDGEVILAEYASRDDATAALAMLAPSETVRSTAVDPRSPAWRAIAL